MYHNVQFSNNTNVLAKEVNNSRRSMYKNATQLRYLFEFISHGIYLFLTSCSIMIYHFNYVFELTYALTLLVMGCRRTLEVMGGTIITTGQKNISRQIFGCFFTYINPVIYQDFLFRRKCLELQNSGFEGTLKIEPKSSKIFGLIKENSKKGGRGGVAKL